MKTYIAITAVHLDVAYTTDQSQGTAKLSLEIEGRWVEVICEKFDPSGFHILHIVEGTGIKSRAA